MTYSFGSKRDEKLLSLENGHSGGSYIGTISADRLAVMQVENCDS